MTAPTPTTKRRNLGRLQLILLALLFATPVLLGTWMYYFAPPSGAKTNYGQLIQPQVTLQTLEGLQQDGKPLASRAWQGKWWMVSFHKGECTDACARQLYIMRQLRLIQGKDADEIERVMFLLDDFAVPTKVLAAYEGNIFIRDQAQRYAQLFAQAGGAKVDVTQHMFLVDPLGNLMMRYPPNADVEKIKKDLGKLIRLSAGWVRTGKAKDGK